MVTRLCRILEGSGSDPGGGIKAEGIQARESHRLGWPSEVLLFRYSYCWYCLKYSLGSSFILVVLGRPSEVSRAELRLLVS